MATAKEGFGLLCPPPEDDDMGYIDMRTTVPRVEHGPKMFLLFSPLIDEKISSFLTYLKSW